MNIVLVTFNIMGVFIYTDRISLILIFWRGIQHYRVFNRSIFNETSFHKCKKKKVCRKIFEVHCPYHELLNFLSLLSWVQFLFLFILIEWFQLSWYFPFSFFRNGINENLFFRKSSRSSPYLKISKKIAIQSLNYFYSHLYWRLNYSIWENFLFNLQKKFHKNKKILCIISVFILYSKWTLYIIFF